MRTRARVLSASKKLVLALVVAMTSGMLACSFPLGGWDLSRLASEEPWIISSGAQGLGDLVPYPVPDERGLRLMACRWSSTVPTHVRLRLEGERMVWARHAVESLAAGVPSLHLEIETGHVEVLPQMPQMPQMQRIEVIESAPAPNEGPAGVGDTLVTCDVSDSRTDAIAGTRTQGRLIRAEIQMRSRVWNRLDERVPVPAEEWTGALMHELGHALGFQGHVRRGPSILVVDQDRLREAGRRALADEAWRDPILEALYRLEIGRSLGRRGLSKSSNRWLRAIEARVGGAGRGPFARVGDRHGELEWISGDGRILRLHFPFWSRQLRTGDDLIGIPSSETRKLLRRSSAPAARRARLRRIQSAAPGSRFRARRMQSAEASSSPRLRSTRPNRNRVTASSGA